MKKRNDLQNRQTGKISRIVFPIIRLGFFLLAYFSVIFPVLAFVTLPVYVVMIYYDWRIRRELKIAAGDGVIPPPEYDAGDQEYDTAPADWAQMEEIGEIDDA